MDSYIRILVSQDLKDKAKEYAKSKGMDLSNFLRMLMIKEIEKER